MSKWIIASILLAYYLFTSGLVFKVNTTQGIGGVDTPYSFALSGEDTGIVGVFTEDDIKCARWLANDSCQGTAIVADINSQILLSSTVSDLDRITYKDADIGQIEGKRWGIDLSNLDSYGRCYIFVNSWNTRHHVYIEGGQLGAGLRISNPLPEFDYPVVYRSGQSVVYMKGEK